MRCGNWCTDSRCQLTELVNTSGGGGLKGSLYVLELGKGKQY